MCNRISARKSFLISVNNILGVCVYMHIHNLNACVCILFEIFSLLNTPSVPAKIRNKTSGLSLSSKIF